MSVSQTPSSQADDLNSNVRHATWLELFYDLVFVVTIAELAALLSHDVSWRGLGIFALLFAPIWWTWASHTFYADRFDTDDLPHRLLTAGQMIAIGALAVSVHAGTGDSSTAFALAYVAARITLILLYLRARRDFPTARPLTTRYAGGFSVGVVIWLISILTPAPFRFVLWGIALLVDYATIPLSPIRPLKTYIPFDNSHLPERFGLFTIIVLGESVLGVVVGVAEHEWQLRSAAAAVCGFAVVLLLWWVYFSRIEHVHLERDPGFTGQIWVYLHLPLVMSLTAVGVGIEHLILHAPDARMLAADRWLVCGAVASSLLATGGIHWASDIHGRDDARLPLRLLSAILALTLAVGGRDLPPLVIISGLFAICLAQFAPAILDKLQASLIKPQT